jgi:hypothetical protein
VLQDHIPASKSEVFLFAKCIEIRYSLSEDRCGVGYRWVCTIGWKQSLFLLYNTILITDRVSRKGNHQCNMEITLNANNFHF